MAVRLPALEHDVERNYMNCFEYQFWYMVRQMGLGDNIPVLNTNSFYCSGNIGEFINNSPDENDVQVPKCYLDNIRCLKANLETYFNAKFKNYLPDNYDSFYIFVKEAISQNRAVFAIYDNYFNTIDNERYYLKQHSYHGTVILGYDDEKEIYMTNKDDINYSDMEKMVEHSINKFNDIGLNTYILTWYACNQNKKKIQQALENDLKITINEWQEEIKFLKEYNEELLNMKNDGKDENITIKLISLRSIFVAASTGIHGNFLYKLRLIEELFENNLEEFFEKFLENRKQTVTIANIIGKASFLIKVDQAEGIDAINRAISNINKYFIEESNLLLEEFKELIKNKVLYYVKEGCKNE